MPIIVKLCVNDCEKSTSAVKINKPDLSDAF